MNTELERFYEEDIGTWEGGPTEPYISEYYMNISPEFKITSENLDKSYLGERTLAVFDKLAENFELYYDTREIGGESEYDFFKMMQLCLNRNADTFERHLEVYDDDIAKPILGRTEKVTYDLHNTEDGTTSSVDTYNKTDAKTDNITRDTVNDVVNKSTEITSDVDTYNTEVETDTKIDASVTGSGQDITHNVTVPADTPEFDTDNSRIKINYGKVETTDNDTNEKTSNTGTVSKRIDSVVDDVGKNTVMDRQNGSGSLIQTGTISNNGSVDNDKAQTGTVVTELSDIGVRPNYESLNGFLENNKTYIQFFIECFEECFAPRYKRIYF